MYISATIFYAVYNRAFEFPVDTRSLQTCISRVSKIYFYHYVQRKIYIYISIFIHELKRTFSFRPCKSINLSINPRRCNSGYSKLAYQIYQIMFAKKYFSLAGRGTRCISKKKRRKEKKKKTRRISLYGNIPGSLVSRIKWQL